MQIIFHEETRTFHLQNDQISYIFRIMENEQLEQLYFGAALRDRADFSQLRQQINWGMNTYPFDGRPDFSMEQSRQEYPVFGTSDFRHPALEIRQENGSVITNFTYVSHEITAGKPSLPGLPATYCEDPGEAMTLTILLRDELIAAELRLRYTIFAAYPAIARSAEIANCGAADLHLTHAMSLSLDLPDSDYDLIQFSGAWARERVPYTRRLVPGLQAVDSARGHSSNNQNPFVILKRPTTDEDKGECIGFSLVYSGNFLAQAEVDAWGVTRLTMGINPFGFDWKLAPNEQFCTPEGVMVYSAEGMNAMSQSFHTLYRTRLARGEWRDKPRPVLINNWEATYFDFDEDRLVEFAKTAHDVGVEMFVLDDGWFGARTSDKAGLGDWVANRDRLPGGITRLAERITDLGMLFGLWFEPEMVNEDSDLFRAHPDWALHTPGRRMSYGRNQYVLDFSRPEVVDYIYGMMAKILSEAKISYVKWDMNRSITECYSVALPADRQGEVFHRYILGVYNLYERLTSEFPHVLFESCASGGARFDPGMLYYAPQGWCSDGTDGGERLRIQYGTSYCYPVSSMGAHVSAVPNHQVHRKTPLHTRFHVACFGAFGYELDLGTLTPEELEEVRGQIAFVKEYREVLQFGTFYRLLSPFDNERFGSWMVVSPDRRTAIVGWYRQRNQVNVSFRRAYLRGLDENLCYKVNGESHWGDELMRAGLMMRDASAEENAQNQEPSCDFDSRLYVLHAE